MFTARYAIAVPYSGADPETMTTTVPEIVQAIDDGVPRWTPGGSRWSSCWTAGSSMS